MAIESNWRCGLWGQGGKTRIAVYMGNDARTVKMGEGGEEDRMSWRKGTRSRERL